MDRKLKYNGAWLTDIDDTLILSGERPSDDWISSLSDFIKVLKEYGILWVPMSGVAIVKLGDRILNRIKPELCSHVYYYGGDGSHKYYWDDLCNRWTDDILFSRLFSDAQSLMILGEIEFREALKQLKKVNSGEDFSVQERIDAAHLILKTRGYSAKECILDRLKEKLLENGFNPEKAETYFRGGSISWMMLGDVSADPYHEPNNLKLRTELIRISREWLTERGFLEDLGATGIWVPFPGARGIKFVLQGNNKERASRELLEWTGLKPEQILFSGNELFEGGNDNMIRNITGVTLLSVGEKEDPGEDVISGLINEKGVTLSGVDSNTWWMNFVITRLERGDSWNEILREMKGAIN
ncbi:MAG: hypothetical protein JEY99_01505 [Spirochaetales bacterium]|nr:hypothetical protein [Spirochaetales bacterium]